MMSVKWLGELIDEEMARSREGTKTRHNAEFVGLAEASFYTYLLDT